MDRYSAADGLPPGDVRSARCDRDGNLWFVPNGGLARIRASVQPARKPLQARITAIRVGGVPLATSKLGDSQVGPLEFPSHRNSIQIEYSAIDYRLLEQLQYRFRLEGASDAWSDPAPNAIVQFANLAPGRYRFLVHAVSSEDPGSSLPASFAFTITPPIWKQWWFQLGLTLAAVSLAWIPTEV